MLNLSMLLAQFQPPEIEVLKSAKQTPKIFGTDVTIVLGVLLAITAVVFFWAIFIRKRPKQVRGALVLERAPRQSKNKDPESHATSSARRKRRKRRPDHPDNWGRNPTLSETGGLPPPRPEDPENPPAQSESSQAR